MPHDFGDVRSALHNNDLERLVEMAPMMTINEIAYVAQHDNPYVVSIVLQKYSNNIASRKHPIGSLVQLLPRDVHVFLYHRNDEFVSLQLYVDELYPYDAVLRSVDMQNYYYVVKSRPGAQFCPKKFIINECSSRTDSESYSILWVGWSVMSALRSHVLSSMSPGELKHLYIAQDGSFTEDDMEIDPFVDAPDGKIYLLSDYIKGHRG